MVLKGWVGSIPQGKLSGILRMYDFDGSISHNSFKRRADIHLWVIFLIVIHCGIYFDGHINITMTISMTKLKFNIRLKYVFARF